MRKVLCLLIFSMISSNSIAQDWSSLFAKKKVVQAVKNSQKKINRTKKKTIKNVKRRISPKIDKHTVMLGVGQTFLTGDEFNYFGSDSLTLDFFYIYTPNKSKPFDLVSNFHWHNLKNRNRELNIRSTNFSFRYKFTQFQEFKPYLMGGLGFYNLQSSRNEKSKTVLGNTLGAGVDLNLNKNLTIGLNLQHHNPFDATFNTGRTLDGSYNKIMLTIGWGF